MQESQRTPRASEYLLGTSNAELQRLGFQHQVWMVETVDLWNRAGFGSGDRLIDLGCGPGFATIDLLWRVGPAGAVTALDNAPRCLDIVRARADSLGLEQLTTQQADVQHLSLEAGAFDGAFVRWLLCFLPEPRRALERLAEALRPGAALVVLDYFNYQSACVQPPDEGCREIFQMYQKSVEALGGSYDVAGHIPCWLEELDFRIDHLVPIQRIGVPGSLLWDWASAFHQSHWPELKARGFIDADAMSRFQSAWERAADRPGTFFYSPPMLGIVARR